MSETILENSRFYQVEGATTGVILFHAYTGSPNDFLSTGRFLQRAGIEVLCPTFKGHGTDDIYDILKKENKTAILVTHDLSEAISVGDRVVILSSRPAKIRNIVALDFDKNLTPLQRRNAKPFASYFNTIWKELQENECS